MVSQTLLKVKLCCINKLLNVSEWGLGSRKVGMECNGTPVWDGDLSVTCDDLMLLRKKDSVFAEIADDLVSLNKGS